MSVSIATGVSSLDVLSSTGAAAVVGAAGGIYAAARMDDESAASENVAAINAALSASSVVNIWRPGTIYINAPLVIPSNTELRLGSRTEIRLTGGVANNLIVSEAFSRIKAGGYLSASMTWVSGKLVTLSRTAHGLSVGDYVFVFSGTLAPSNFCGVFPVTTVTDADNVVIKLHRAPTASPTGTVQYVKANTNVSVTGGVWNMDYPAINSFGSDPLARFGILMGAVAHLRVRGVAPKNCAKYAVYLCGLYDFVVDGVVSDTTPSDIVKVYGPSVGGVVENISGSAGDDVVSVQPKDAAGFLAYQFAWGDCQNIKVKNVSANSTSNLIAVFSSVDQFIGGIEIDGVSGHAGSTYSGVSLYPSYNNAVMGRVKVRNVVCGGAYNFSIRSNGFTGAVFDQVVYEDSDQQPDDYTLDRNSVFTDTNLTIRDLTISGVNFRNKSWPASSGYAVNLNSTVTNLRFHDCVVDFANSTGNFCQLLGAVENVFVSGLYASASCTALLRIFAGTPTIHFVGNDLNCGQGVSTNVACKINATGNRLNLGSGGFARSNAAVAIQIRSGGNDWVSSNVFANGSSTGLWEFYGLDLKIDVGATGVQKTISGQHCFNIGAGRGTLVQNRLVTCNGTAWVQVDDTTKTF